MIIQIQMGFAESFSSRLAALIAAYRVTLQPRVTAPIIARLKRVAGSNLISIPLDSLLFNLIAFYGVFGNLMLVGIVFGEIVAKFATGTLAALWRAPAASPDPGAEASC